MTRVFDAPRRLVFDAWTKLQLLKRWLGVRGGWSFVVCEVDLRVGGAYRFVWRGPNGKEMGMGGVYREVVPPERLVATEKFDDPWYEGEALELGRDSRRGWRMKRKFFSIVVSCLLTMFFAALAEAPAGGAATPASTPSPAAGGATTVTCDFSNPGYSGWCRVTRQLRRGVRPRGFCSQVLACLNDTRCIRTYCNATTIRGGWKLESVETPPKAQ